MNTRFYLALTPWLVFAMADRSAGLGPRNAAATAAVVAAVVVVRDIRLRRPHRLAVMGVGLFAAQAVAAAALHDPSWMARYDRPLSTSILSLALLGSALGDRSPTSPDARFSLRWAATAAAVAASFFVAATGGGPLTGTVFNWLVPMAVVAAALLYCSPAPPVARDEVASALDLLDGLLGHPSGTPRNTPAPGASLRLVTSSAEDQFDMGPLAGKPPKA